MNSGKQQSERWRRFVWMDETEFTIRDKNGKPVDLKELVKREKERLKQKSKE